MTEERRRQGDLGAASAGGGAPPSFAVGLLLAAVASSSFGIVITLTRLAYNGGASPGAAMEIRYLTAVAIIGTVMVALGRGLRPPRALYGPLVRVALSNLGVTAGYMTSILFIPVSLATVVFYTYPLMVIAVAPIFHGHRSGRQGPTLGRQQFAAFGLAFAGLVLALGPSIDVLDWRGVVLALLAAVSATTVFMVSPQVVRAYHALGVTLYSNLIGAGIIALFLPILGGFVLPESSTGWIGLSGLCILYVGGILSMFVALHAAGAVYTSLIFNLEPLVAIVAATILLGERLVPLQMGGVALVIGALMLAGLARPRN
jgi:drug/metabolite transporter (DMT)-like permease